MNTLKDQVNKAFDAKKNDVNSFVWKFQKVREGNSFTQDEIKLMDATEEQLNAFYQHCMTMLYNKDPKNIGRKPLLDLVKDQITKCNAMLFVNWLTVGSDDRKPYPKFEFFQDMKKDLEMKEDTLPRNTWETAKITKLYSVPSEFAPLTIQNVFDACLDQLGVFNKQHITLSFITKMGLWFTNEELKDLAEKDPQSGKLINRLKVVKARCNLRPETTLFINQKNGLSYKEFRAMRNLKNVRYSGLTTDQLTILRDKILNRLSIEILDHIDQWKERIRQIKLVAKTKGYTINEVEIA